MPTRPDRPQTDALPARSAPLLPWQEAFAEWLANHDKLPPVSEQLQRAIAFAHEANPDQSAALTHADLRAIKGRKAFKAHLDQYRSQAVSRARQTLEVQLADYVRARHEALKMAVANEDVNAIDRLTLPVVDRVWPTKVAGPTGNTQVVIHLGPKQQQLLENDIAYEVLEAEIVPAESDDG